MKKLLIGVCAGVFAAVPAWGDFVYLTAGDPRDNPSFQAAGRWSDGEAPHDDADYLVALGGEGGASALRTPANGSTSVTFAGRSLTIGDPDSDAAGMILQKAGNTAAVTYPDLRLVRGCYSQGSEYASKSSTLFGDWTVLSRADDPFSLLGANNRNFLVAATLHGEEDAVLRICHSTTELNGWFSTTLAGTNTLYNGSFVVSDEGAYLEVAGDVDPLGNPASPNNARAVVLRNRGGILARSAEPVAVNPEKVFWVETTRGRVFTDADQEGRLALTVAGEGILEKVGAGRTVFAGTLANAGLQVLEGEAVLDESLAAPANYPVVVGSSDEAQATGAAACLQATPAALDKVAVRVGPGGALIPPSADDRMTLANVVFAGGGVMARTDLTAGTCSCVTLDPSCTVAWPLAVALDQPFPGIDGPDVYPVVKIPAALKTVTPEDFVNATPGSDLGLPRVVVVVETDEAGDQLVSLKRAGRVVEMTATGDSSYFFATGTQWSDGVPPHGDADYLVYATGAIKVLRTGDKNLQVATFEGNTLTLKGTTDGNRAQLTLKAETTTVPDLTAYGFTSIGLAGYRDRSDCTHALYGALHVRSTVAAPLRFLLESDRQLALYADLDGPADAYLAVLPSNSKNNIHLSHFYGNNTNYFGSIYLSQRGQGTPSLTKYVGISIEREENLGGNPPVFKFDTLILGYYSRLDCRGDVTIDDSNRGIFFDGASQLLVEEGETLTLKSPLTFNGKVYKQGAGRLALGAPLAFGAAGGDAAPTEGKNLLLMTEGSLQALTSRAFDGLSVDCQDNVVRLVVDLKAGDEALRAEGVVNTYATPFVFGEEGRLQVELFNVTPPRRGSFTQPVLTIPAAAAETALEKVDFASSLPGYLVAFEEETVGDNVRVNAVFTDVRGTAVILR